MLFKIFIVILIFSVVYGERHNLNNPNHPVKWFETTRQKGQHNMERVSHLYAEILPKHLRSSGRVNFPLYGEIEQRFKKSKADGDERGHLLASQFSGPPEWWNMSPQNTRANRNKDYQSLTTEWFNTECEVKKFLSQDKKNNRMVKWEVEMNYKKDSNRPDSYELTVKFFEGGVKVVLPSPIHSKINNPFKRQDHTFWICNECKYERGGHNGCKRA